MTSNDKVTIGRNGVAISAQRDKGSGQYRSYEVYQRERVGQSTPKLAPGELRSSAFLVDPYPNFATMREDYPCYRDWSSNAYWISQYNDVTSILMDDANFETRTKCWYYGLNDYGRDFRHVLPVLTARAHGFEQYTSSSTQTITGDLKKAGGANLAMDFAAKLPLMILAQTLGLPEGDFDFFAENYWQMQRGARWEPKLQNAGRVAMDTLSAYFDKLVEQRRSDPGEDLISALATLDVDGPAVTGHDVTVTLLEDDHETLHGALSNMWAQLFLNPEQMARVRDDRRMVKFAYLETLRHSAPIVIAQRFAIHEVERFGRLLPTGALMLCAIGAANRDPRIYQDPDKFLVGREDLCQREPRGQYRADGLAAGIAIGLGQPSVHPAVPEDRPLSLYALTRDAATTASTALLDALPSLRLKAGTDVTFRSLRWGEMHTCWNLAVDV